MSDKTQEQLDAEARKQAEKEAKAAAAAEAKAAKQAEREAKKAAVEAEKAAKKAEREATKQAEAAAKEAAKAEREAAKAAKEQAKANAKAEREANRSVKQNGIAVPKKGTVGDVLWTLFAKESEKLGQAVSIKRVKELVLELGLEIKPASVLAGYARWKKFHGLTGRISSST